MTNKGENIYKRKDGRREGRFPSGRNGKKIYVSVCDHKYMKLRQKLIHSRTRGRTADCISFERVAHEWLEDVKPRVKESTFVNYEFLLKKHIIPYFSDQNMSALDVGDVGRFMREKSANGRLKRDGGLSNKYLRDIVSIVKSVSNFCEREYSVPDNIRNIKLPKVERQERRMPNSAEQKQLVKWLLSHISLPNLGILLAMYAGLRLGEICGLKWEDYDSVDETITISRTVLRIIDNKGGTKLYVGTPKSQNSARVIPLPSLLVKLLNKFRSENDFYIISGSCETPEPLKLRKIFKSILKENNIRDMRFHDLRHLFASNCVKMNFDIKSLSEILGHSNAAMTLNRYVHTSMDTKRMYMNRLKS